MLFEKEDLYLKNEEALQRENGEILALEAEILQIENRMKEKA
jgi:hypothetical protein